MTVLKTYEYPSNSSSLPIPSAVANEHEALRNSALLVTAGTAVNIPVPSGAVVGVMRASYSVWYNFDITAEKPTGTVEGTGSVYANNGYGSFMCEGLSNISVVGEIGNTAVTISFWTG